MDSLSISSSFQGNDSEVESRNKIKAKAGYQDRWVALHGYSEEPWSTATKKRELADIPPGTKSVSTDVSGEGRQEITWDRYHGERRDKFYTGDRARQEDWTGVHYPPARKSLSEMGEVPGNTSADLFQRPTSKDRRWTEVRKDLVEKEAIEKEGYEYKETDEYFYIMEYLRYVHSPFIDH